MVVKMIKWRPWTPLESRKFEVKIVVHCITGLVLQSGDVDVNDDDEKVKSFDELSKLKVEIRWKGGKANGFGPLKKKSVKKSSTRVQELGSNGVVHWDEEFKSVCEFSKLKSDENGSFLPWEVAFLVFNGSEERSKRRNPLAPPAVLNLAEFACLEDAQDIQINVPLSIARCTFKCSPCLCVSLSLMVSKTTKELSVEVQRPMLFAPLSPCFGASVSMKKDEASSFKAGLRKVKSLTDYVSSRKAKKAYHGDGSSDSKFSTGSDSELNYPFDTDSFDETEDGESEESREDVNAQSSCGYGTLVHANLAGGAIDLKINCEDDELVYYSNKQLDVDSSPPQDFSIAEQVLRQSPKFGILAWRKRKLSFRSPRVKGEPLLRKDYGEEGGDDIDFDRRQLSSDESMGQFEESEGSGSLISEFGDDNFAIGSWEEKEVLSRDGSMKLRTQVFFASIDQRSERAAGESACTALVAVIADWFHSNQGEMPIKSEFDSLIREGSLQWRNLCDNEDYRERFPDKHFDLETVLQAKIRPLAVVPERSFIGFFHPQGLEEESFHFLKGAMSFDNIWDEICKTVSEPNHNSEPLVYIISWNDHFFLLRVDSDAYYIIDTLGERLYEGCNQAYILKFDRDTTIERVSHVEEASSSKEKQVNKKAQKETLGESDQGLIVSPQSGAREEERMVCKGKESCREYIQSFLAAIPIRELQVDMKKGLMSSTPLHHRLQIEFNYTSQLSPAPTEYTGLEATVDIPTVMATDVAVDVPPPIADVHASMVADVSPSFAADVPASMMAVAVA